MRVPPAPFDNGYDVRSPKVTRIGKESARTSVPMFHRPAEGVRICRPHTFRQVLARFGVQLQMIEEVIRQFYDGMRACVRNNDGRCSEWFEVAQGYVRNAYFPRCCSTSYLLRYSSSD